MLGPEDEYRNGYNSGYESAKKEMSKELNAVKGHEISALTTIVLRLLDIIENNEKQ